jgi:hypothetical protein
LEACSAEIFSDTRTIDRNDRDPWLVVFVPNTDLLLLDVASAWATRAHCHQSISSGPRDLSQEWARSIYDAYPDIDGIYYPAANYGPGRNLALFERAINRMPASPRLHRPLSDPGLRPILAQVADLLGYALV